MVVKNKHPTADQLRLQAEETLRQQATLPAENLTLHELRVHQIELEMQNEELRRSQVELDAARARYFGLYDLAPVGYCTLSELGLILETNFTTASLLGKTRDELVKQPFSRFILKEYQDSYYMYRKQLIESDTPQSCELQMLKKDGVSFWARLEGIATKDSDGNPVFRIVLSDVTKREQQLLTANAALKVANDELESFSYSVSHDLRAPLNAIVGFTKVMLEEHNENLNPKAREVFSHITTAAKKMGTVIDGLLELSRLTRTELIREQVKLSTMAESIANEFQQLNPERQVKYIIAKNIVANGDSRLLMIVMNNLMNNAYKFSSLKTETIIEFGCLKIDGKDTYFLRDNGAGFDMRHMKKLFQPFERLHANNEFPGTGIGLATVQRIIHRHSGKIWAEAQLNLGTTFYFTLK